MTSGRPWDAVVVGGGAAGLAAALTLARARRRTLLVDAGEQRNRTGLHSHGVLGFDGTPPALLLERGRADVLRYGGALASAPASDAVATAGGFALDVGGERVSARHLLVATGVRDLLPDVPGLAAQWGTGVVVCPYCDGWESRDSRIGVLGTGRKSIEQAHLVRQWSNRVVLLPAGAVEPTAEDLVALAARGIEVRGGGVGRVVERAGALTGLEVDGVVVPLDRVFTAPVPQPRDDLLRGLGAARVETAAGSFVRVGTLGATSVPGVFAAGNVVDPSLKVQSAAGAGMAAGTGVNESLVRRDVDEAVARSR